MSGSVNKVIIIGRLGAEPEMKYTGSGSAVANLSVATSESWKDKEGNKQEKTEWHRIVAWGKLAELAGQYLSKGRQVYIEGKIQTRSWEDKEGQKRYTTEVVANAIQFLGSQSDSRSDNRSSSSGASNFSAPDLPPPGGMGGGMEDDVPF